MLKSVLLISLEQHCEVIMFNCLISLQFTEIDSTFLCTYLHYFDKQVFIICIDNRESLVDITSVPVELAE